MNSRQRRKARRAFNREVSGWIQKSLEGAKAIRDISARYGEPMALTYDQHWQGVPVDISNNAPTSKYIEAVFNRHHGKLLITDVDHTNKIVTVQYVK